MSNLRSAASEADRLLSQREGIHNLHGARMAVRAVCEAVERGEPLYTKDLELTSQYVEIILAKMRQAVHIGQYPKPTDELSLRLHKVAGLLFRTSSG